jgi:hypothetical protein
MDERLPAERGMTPPATGERAVGGSTVPTDRLEVLAG